MLGINGGLRGKRRVPSRQNAGGLWFPNEQNIARRLRIWPVANGDPFFDNVSLLLHYDGANNSTDIIDSSLASKSPSSINGGRLTTAISKWGSSSLTSSTVSTEASPTVGWTNAYTGLLSYPFTLESWLYRPSGSAPVGIYGIGYLQTKRVNIYYLASNQIEWEQAFIGVRMRTANSVPVNQWFHFAITVNSANTATFWVNGVADATLLNTDNIGGNGLLSIFCEPNHFVDDTRLTVGVARYESNFTPPAAPFPDE